ncbi:MAG TPA: NAD(P)H-dependent oxidoreductase [Stellaceae bacterium]|nr:NAD(P)H-dependent oxidoreductase [Stellaceae bacterium]
MKLLHIDSSILGDNSVSRKISAAIVERLRTLQPELSVSNLDLAAAPPPHAAADTMPSAHPLAAMAPGAEGHAAADALLEGFLSADIIVIGAPMYNFTISSQLKAWIDRIIVPGKTVRYGAKGPEGLAGNKRVIVALARGGFYGADTSGVSAEHAESYLRIALGFIGIKPEIIVAEGVSRGEENKTKAIEAALGRAAQLKAA